MLHNTRSTAHNDAAQPSKDAENWNAATISKNLPTLRFWKLSLDGDIQRGQIGSKAYSMFRYYTAQSRRFFKHLSMINIRVLYLLREW